MYIYIFNIYYQLLVKHGRQDKSSFEIVSIKFDQSSFYSTTNEMNSSTMETLNHVMTPIATNDKN